MVCRISARSDNSMSSRIIQKIVHLIWPRYILLCSQSSYKFPLPWRCRVVPQLHSPMDWKYRYSVWVSGLTNKRYLKFTEQWRAPVFMRVCGRFYDIDAYLVCKNRPWLFVSVNPESSFWYIVSQLYLRFKVPLIMVDIHMKRLYTRSRSVVWGTSIQLNVMAARNTWLKLLRRAVCQGRTCGWQPSYGPETMAVAPPNRLVRHRVSDWEWNILVKVPWLVDNDNHHYVFGMIWITILSYAPSDLYLMHWPDCMSPGRANREMRAETWRALEELYDEGTEWKSCF